MSNQVNDGRAEEPTVGELVSKALAAQVIDETTAGELRVCGDLDEALIMFACVADEYGIDAISLLKEWGIII